jgi:hypothetical protein
MGVRRMIRRLAALSLTCTTGFLVYLAAPASAAPAPTTVFTYTGAAQDYVVGTGITTVAVDADGGAGGGGSTGGAGGNGGSTHSIVSVTPGETLQVNVGGVGGTASGGTGAAGGFNGGAAGGTGADGGGGGGGASDVRRAPDALTDRLVVAAGGGGGGGYGGGAGGVGSEAGADGGDAQGQGGLSGGNGGTGGAGNAATSGGDGTAGQGGAGGNGVDAGAGGGGGLLGGGGGGGNSCCFQGGGGGGGGSSFGPTGSTFEAGSQSSNGQVSITALPDTTIDSHPSARTRRRSASFTFSSPNSGVTFQCQLDGAGFAPCTPPVSYTALARTRHTFQVRALDVAGNADPTPATFNWRIKR